MRQMNRFFRENSRVLLIVFMSLLLVVFLIGDVIQWMGSGRGAENFKVGDAFGKAIHINDLGPYEQRLSLLSALGMSVPAAGENPALTYYLLIEEARRMGIHVSRDQVMRMLGDSGFNANMIDGPRRNLKMSLDGVYDSIGELLGVTMLASVQAVSIGESDPRMRLAYRNQSQEAEVKVSILDANVMAKSMPEPSEDAILTHFNEAKDRSDEHTDEKLVFGYRIPDRVAVEYLTVDPEAIKPDIRVRDNDLRAFYDKNAARYLKPGPPPASSPTDPDPQPEMIPMTFEEAKERVREDCRTAKAIERAQQLVNEIQAEARRTWVGQSKVDGFLESPPADKLVSFTDLRDRFSAQLPVKYGKTELLDSTAFASAPDGLPAGSYSVGRQKTFAAQLAFRVKGLYTPIENDPLPYLNLNEPSPVLVQTRMDSSRAQVPYKAFVMRVVQVAPAGPPASVDEVREKVVKNLKLMAAFAEAEKQARSIMELAYSEGMEFAVAQHSEILNMYTGVTTRPAAPAATQPTAEIERAIKLLQPFVPQGRFTRRPGGAADVPRVAKLHDDIFSLADGAFSTTMPFHRLVLSPAVRDRKWVVAELIDVKPLYEGEYEQAREQRLQQTGSMVQQTFMRAWFDEASVQQRTGFVSAQPTSQ